MSQLAHEYPRFQEAGVALVMLSTDGLMRARQIAEQTAAPFPVLSDGDDTTTVAYNLFELGIALPTTVLVDRGGHVCWQYVGQTPQDRPSPEMMLAAVARLSDGTESPERR